MILDPVLTLFVPNNLLEKIEKTDLSFMETFSTLTGVAAAVPLQNVDTDMIIPKQFLKTIERTGLGAGLFYDMRHDENGNKITDFVLHRPPYDQARILICGHNFGCGSSREHAPWALLDFGIRCLISTGFADIFFNNCFKNGILPIVLGQETVSLLMCEAENATSLVIDLPHQVISKDSSKDSFAPIHFDVDPFRKQCLIEGLDDIALTLKKQAAITAFEQENQHRYPWLWETPENHPPTSKTE